jgi:uncharacterized LabA/DUF88 family protein
VVAAARAVVFIDGNNWYHALREVGETDLFRLDYAKISQKLVGPGRRWVETRYYIGRLKQEHGGQLYAEQRRFLAVLEQTDSRIKTFLGRIETHPVDNPVARELLDYLHGLAVQIDRQVFHTLLELAKRHRRVLAHKEKAVDVMIAVDMVAMAQRDEYDAAYLLSADGDFTPVADAVRRCGKKVYGASALHGAQLAAAVDTFIRVRPEWFRDCYRP